MENTELLENEIWKPLEEYKGYSISNRGRIKNDKKGNILKTRNRGEISISINGKRKSDRINRLLLKYFYEENVTKVHKMYTNLPKEDSIWKNIIGYENKYEINQYGQVRNKLRGNILTITSKSTVILCKHSKCKEYAIINLLNQVFDKGDIVIENERLIAKSTKIENLDGEIWKEIKDFPNYEVSNKGRVKSINRTKIDLMNRVITNQGQLLVPTIVAKYLRVNLYKNGIRFSTPVHQIVAKTFIENPNPTKYNQINHINGVRTNNEVSNLEWCDALHNIKHAINTGLRKIKGEENPNAQLTNKEVVEIRENYVKKRGNIKKLAAKYGVSSGIISNLVNNKTYKNI